MIERFGFNAHFHSVIRHNKVVYLSGQTATEAGDDIKLQSEQALAKIEKLLNENGSDKDHILHADVYVRDRKDVAAFNAAWDSWITPEYAPTRALMVSALGREPILVEVVVTAAEK